MPGDNFYSYEDKYLTDGSYAVIPAPIGDSALSQAKELAIEAYRALRCEGLSRVDFFWEDPRYRVQRQTRSWFFAERGQHNAGFYPHLDVPENVDLRRSELSRDHRPTRRSRIGAPLPTPTQYRSLKHHALLRQDLPSPPKPCGKIAAQQPLLRTLAKVFAQSGVRAARRKARSSSRNARRPA